MTKKICQEPAARGRPREFDVGEALERALLVFWDKGYGGASLSDLTSAMGINRPSLYAAFGSKEELFRRAVDRYIECQGAHVRRALGQPTARGVAETLLFSTAELLTDPENPGGCLLVQGALTCNETAGTIQHELASRRADSEATLRDRFERARSEGDLPANADPADLARYVTTVVWGMSVQARTGATREGLRRVADRALRAWPADT